jgi:acyl-CoA dehydrogenase
MTDPTLTPELTALRDRVSAFVREIVIPAERELGLGQPTESMRTRLQAAASAEGLLSPHVPEEFGGLGLSMFDQSVVFEEAGYSLLGPLALNCAAPDEGNMHLLSVVASEAQQARYLRPLAAGRLRSCFAMTEPAPGAGSDPAALRTTAKRVDGGWSIDGRKWLITGAAGAAFAIVMAKTSAGDAGRLGATMFIVDSDNPGLEVVREIPTLDHGMIGGHCEVVLRECFVEDDAVLGEPDEGFRYAQVRLAPARLTHCMRWLGIARRSLDIALERTRGRELFGQQLHALGLAQALIADSAIDIESSRALIRQAVRVIDAGGPGGYEASLTKTYVSEAVDRVVDRSMQLAGGAGVTHETPLGRFMNEVRAFRIYDGPAETHRWSIARRVVRNAAAASSAGA